VPSVSNDIYEFGDFRLNAQTRVLSRERQPVPLPPKAYEVLLVLVQNGGQVLSKDELMNAVWPDSFVEESNLTQTVFILRKALGERSEHRYIVTVPGRGYCFVALVKSPDSEKTNVAVAAPESPLTENLIGKRVSHYRVLQILGGGGMGVVYKAEDLKLGRGVAVKFLPSELASDPVAFERLQREARAASALDHPNICSIYELSEYKGQPFIVMQLLEGQTVREWIESASPENLGLRLDRLVDLGIQIADGLEVAHQKGIIHRDIKPANIFVTATGQAKILDFGVAKFLAETPPERREEPFVSGVGTNTDLTRTGASVGTPSYQSPEQVRGEALDPRTDLFSLGLVLYEMATGQRAFAGDATTEIRNAVLTQSVMPGRRANLSIPSVLEKILRKALEKDREQRYQSAEALRCDLQSLREKRRSEVYGRARILRLRYAAPSVALLLIVATLVIANFQKNQRSPFEVIKTTRLTSTGQAAKAAISPDGRYIAHTLLVSGRESLRVRRARMLDDVELVPAQPVRYMGIGFSPDNELVYSVVRNAADASGVLYRVPVIGGPPQRVKGNIFSPIAISPDGKRFAFVRETASESILLVAEFGSEREQALIAHKLPVVLDYPAWSPDGRTVMYTVTDSSVARSTGSDARIMGVRVADGTESAISNQTWAFVKQLAWLSDGSGLVMSARGQEESGVFHIWCISYPGGTGRKVTAGLNNQVGASISADSRALVTVEENTFFNIWRSTRSHEPTLVVSGSSGTSAPAWTPDRRIVFEEELDGHRSIWSVDADGRNRKQLTLMGNNYDHSVSANGRQLVWVSDNGSPAIWTMEMDNGHPIMVAAATGEPVPDVSPEGDWIAYTAISKKHWATLWRVPSSGGQAQELNDKLWMRPVISPDGKWIAGFYSDHSLGPQKFPESIAVISADGGGVRTVFPIAASVSFLAGPRWSPDGRELTYINHGKDGDNIWSHPVDGGVAHQVTQFSGLTLFTFDWSADGTELAFSRGIQARDVVLVEDARR
jgi:serine/threonine protein kinase/Tol biopolymer transport system component